MVNWLRSLFKMALNARKRTRYIDTLLWRYKFTKSDIEIALLLYDHMKVMFVDNTADVYITKSETYLDGCYHGWCIGYRGKNGVALFTSQYTNNVINGIYNRGLAPFTMSRLFEENPHLFEKMDIPRFKSTAELKMKLELMGRDV